MEYIYTSDFAVVYNRLWGSYASNVAPAIREFYQRQPISRVNKTILDLGCGTGQLAQHLLQSGFRVIGIDQSEAMLEQAVLNAKEYTLSGMARFLPGDAANFALDEKVGLVVSTYAVLNHMPDLEAMRSCFRCARAVLDDEGLFLFDLNTRTGLKGWATLAIEDTEQLMVISRGTYDEEAGYATLYLTGFGRNADGTYDRFTQTVSNHAYGMEDIRTALAETGWHDVYCARIRDLAAPFADPESERRIFFIAHR